MKTRKKLRDRAKECIEFIYEVKIDQKHWEKNFDLIISSVIAEYRFRTFLEKMKDDNSFFNFPFNKELVEFLKKKGG